MEIQEVTLQEYSSKIIHPYHIYGSGAFSEINKNKVDKLFYLLFKNDKNKYYFGLTGGIKENSFQTPFSSPFGGFVPLRKDVSIKIVEEVVSAITIWCDEKGFKTVSFTLPPNIYYQTFISKQVNSLFRLGYTINNLELNHSFDLHNFGAEYIQKISRSARRNIIKARSNRLTFKKCVTIDEQYLAYEVIENNRKMRGFPLRMSWNDIKITSKIIQSVYFLVFNPEGIPIASAILFHVASEIVQIIYWGDLPEYSEMRTMNYLSLKIFEYYKTLKVRLIDIGPSSENSVPNYGLCDFKESIGCDVSIKYSLMKDLKR
jgi:hypothetical protein